MTAGAHHPAFDLSVVIPCYNEEDNIPLILPRVCEILEICEHC